MSSWFETVLSDFHTLPKSTLDALNTVRENEKVKFICLTIGVMFIQFQYMYVYIFSTTALYRTCGILVLNCSRRSKKSWNI